MATCVILLGLGLFAGRPTTGVAQGRSNLYRPWSDGNPQVAPAAFNPDYQMPMIDSGVRGGSPQLAEGFDGVWGVEPSLAGAMSGEPVLYGEPCDPACGPIAPPCGPLVDCPPLIAGWECYFPGRCCPLWVVSASGLVMGRSEPNCQVWGIGPARNGNYYDYVLDGGGFRDGEDLLRRDECWDYDSVLTTSDAGIRWGGGFDIRAMRCIGCCWGIEGAYWGVYGVSAEASYRDPFHKAYDDNLYTPFNTDYVSLHDGRHTWSASWLFQEADEYRLRRENDFHNVEINFVRNVIGGTCGGLPLCCDPCNPWRVDAVFGIHWFRFDECLRFTAVDYDFCSNKVYAEAYMQDSVKNDLLGFHLGARLRRFIGPRFELAVSPMVGIYGNHMEHRFQVGNTLGMNVGVWSHTDQKFRDFPVESSRCGVSFIGRCDLQARWNITCRFTAFIGYRVLFATGIALADNQIPPDWSNQKQIACINNSGDLVLHGAMAGFEWRF